MQSSRKSFKAFSVAQPIKKEIDETLIKVELEKRKFLTLERQENHLRDTLEKKRIELNSLKAKQPQTKTYSSKTWQTSNTIGSVDKNYLHIHDNIQHLKSDIIVHRKQIQKFKDMNTKLQDDIRTMLSKNEELNAENLSLQNENQSVKNQILSYRENNLNNNNEFYHSHTNINKSNVQEINERKKFGVKQKSFLGQEMKNSKIIPIDGLSDQIRNSGLKFSPHVHEILTQSLPLAKQRIKTQIYKNKQKIKITQNYRRFGDSLEQMFKVMKQYKGRDDLNFIAHQFVAKEKQLQKIEEYIAQLESRMLASQRILADRKSQDVILEAAVNAKIEKSDERYIALQKKAKVDIQKLKKEEQQFYKWFVKVSNILLPLTQQNLTRNNASNMIGDIQQSLNIRVDQIQKKNPAKVGVLPDLSDSKQNYNQLLSYEKMRELAAEFVKGKRNN